MPCSNCGGHAGKAGHRAPTCPRPKRKGPKRKGSPRAKHKYDEIFAELGAPPLDDPMALVEWAQAANAIAMFETMMGRGNQERNIQIRGFSGMIVKLLRPDMLAKAARAVENAGAPTKPQRPQGPTLTRRAKISDSSGKRSPVRGN